MRSYYWYGLCKYEFEHEYESAYRRIERFEIIRDLMTKLFGVLVGVHNQVHHFFLGQGQKEAKQKRFNKDAK